MRRTFSLLAVAVVVAGLVSTAIAQEAKQNTADNAPATAQQDATALAQLKANMHRTLADLVEARAAKQPDQAKIEELIKKLQQIREQVVTQRQATLGAAGACPYAGRGCRSCCCVGCDRDGLGCAACGRCCGNAGWGGPGKGPGMGGRGGMGRGCGPGAGVGLGMGPGAGGYFVDRDKNGVCDRAENRQAARP